MMYYRVLLYSQTGGLDITEWLLWFLDCLESAIKASENRLSEHFNKARFWNAHQRISFNDRQRRMLDLLLEGYSEKMTAAEWARVNCCSHFTAVRGHQRPDSLRHLGTKYRRGKTNELRSGGYLNLLQRLIEECPPSTEKRPCCAVSCDSAAPMHLLIVNYGPAFDPVLYLALAPIQPNV